MSRRQDILAQVTAVPSLPAVVVKLKEYLNDPEVNFTSLARVIELDPGLTANVLQLSNSAYFGWRGTISSVRDAISRLGTSRIFQMVLCMSVAPLVRRPVKGYGLTAEQLWDHSIAAAICSEQIAFKLQLSCANQAFTTGLLHDLGKIVLGTFVEIDDQPIREVVASDQLTFDEAERMVLGIDHAEAGAHLLRAWNLPEDVVAAARWHHDPGRNDTSYQDLVDVTHCADSICLKGGWGAGREALQYRLNEQSAVRLGLEEKMVEGVTAQVVTGLEELRGMFTPAPAGKYPVAS